MSSKLFITCRRDDALVIAAMESIGSLCATDIRREAEELMAQMQALGVTRAVFDMQRAEYFGSQVIELMILLWRYLAPAHGTLALCHLSPPSREVIHMVGLDTLWPVCDTLDEALAASDPC